MAAWGKPIAKPSKGLTNTPGLKSQHVTSIQWLARVTGAEVKGLEIGSKTLEFRPSRGPGGLLERNIHICAESPAASALLIFQATFPFLLFASNEANEPIELEISGGTNVSFSPSYEYLDQVLLPMLEQQFGIIVDRKLQKRGWSSGNISRGSLWFKILPLPWASTLKLKADFLNTIQDDILIKSVDATIIAPSNMHDELEGALKTDLQQILPGVSLTFIQVEDSGHDARLYVLLVAKSERLRWGRDLLYRRKRKGNTIHSLAKEISKSVTRALGEEMRQGGTVDEFLQDQLVIFQALAEGKTSFPRTFLEDQTSQGYARIAKEQGAELDHLHLRVDKVKGPLGESQADSTHTRTARWVMSEILEPKVKWYNRGTVCQGIGLVSGCGIISM